MLPQGAAWGTVLSAGTCLHWLCLFALQHGCSAKPCSLKEVKAVHLAVHEHGLLGRGLNNVHQAARLATTASAVMLDRDELLQSNWMTNDRPHQFACITYNRAPCPKQCTIALVAPIRQRWYQRGPQWAGEQSVLASVGLGPGYAYAYAGRVPWRRL